MRTLIRDEPFTTPGDTPWQGRGDWPCRWIAPRDAAVPFVAAFRLRFAMPADATVRLHVTADERYELFLDGARLGRGPERGHALAWRYETFDLPIAAGEHVFVARVWALGEYAPVAQHSACPGFLLCPQDPAFHDLLGTGRAPWEAKLLDGYRFTPPLAAVFAGWKLDVDGARFPWGFERGDGEGWLPTRALHRGFSAALRNECYPHEQLLTPAELPPQLDVVRRGGRARHVSQPHLSETHSIPLADADHLAAEAPAWDALLRGEAPLALPPNTRRRVIVDLEDYLCAYPELVVSGGAGASIRIHWQEGLFVSRGPWDRDNRDGVAGRYFATMWHDRDGVGDRYTLDGGERRRLDTLWWHAGRYVELLVETSDAPLTIESLELHETRFPLERADAFAASDERLERAAPLMVRALQMCAHETYMDCPYYEQLQYIGDTRLQALVTFCISRDDRLVRKALRLFDESRLASGLTQSRFPSRQRQIIPPFSLWWVAMVHDYLLWRDDPQFVRERLPGVRAVCDAFTRLRADDGLLRSPEGWNYVDWVEAWPGGEPPGAEPGGMCGPLNWQYVYALTRHAALEEVVGDPELALRARRLAGAAATALATRLWDAERGLYADDPAHTIFTEHSQCLALLSELLPAEQRDAIAARLFADTSLTRPTVYFMHYAFEACRTLGRSDVLLERMEQWHEMVRMGFRTTYENGNPHTNRSDCHAWGAHPLYHYYATILGVRPTAAGFARVEVAPQLGPLTWARGTLAHPRGEIRVEVQASDGELHGHVVLPAGVRGVLRANGATTELAPGEQTF